MARGVMVLPGPVRTWLTDCISPFGAVAGLVKSRAMYIFPVSLGGTGEKRAFSTSRI